jgi:acetylornithine deacetylase/succinyl-diaminopimelate desuccinylase-like protein
MDALVGHLRDHAPWGADVEVTPGSGGEPIALDSEGPAFDAWRTAMTAAWGNPPVDIGVGGSIPFVAELRRRFPDAAILLTGAADPTSAAHGPDESLDLDELRRAILAEAIALRLLAG